MIIKINLFLFFNIQNNISYGEGKILSLNTEGNRKNLIHDVSTLPGSSGSPLILKSNDYRVIGIHKAGDNNLRINYATRKNLIHDVSTLPGANDELYNRRFRVLNKMNRLSNILLSKRRGYISLIKMIQSNVLLMKLEKLLLGIL